MPPSIQDSTLLVAIITKNVQPHIYNVIKNVEAYTSLAKDHFVLFVDGYSTDLTYDVCKSWCIQDPSRRMAVRQPSKQLPRPLSLSEARNMYMSLLEDKFGEKVFLLMLDADEVNASPIDLKGFLTCWNYPSWDMMGANQSKVYYDVWALRNAECPTDCWDMVRATGNRKKYVDDLQIPKPSTHPLIECQSCFGGAGLYYTPKLSGNRYVSFLPGGKEICEHVPFHSQLLQKGGKIFINPAWINAIGS